MTTTPRPPVRSRAFTLLEVMIAMSILSIALFAVLGVVIAGLDTARRLQKRRATASYPASVLSLTNRLEEEVLSGDFGDFKEVFPGAQWEANIYEVGTNGLFRVDFTVAQPSGKSADVSHLNILMFRPGSGNKRGLGR